MKKRLIWIFAVLVISLFVLSACEQYVGRRINYEQDNCRRDLSRCGNQEECGNDYPCSFVCNEPLPGPRGRNIWVWTRYPCELGCNNDNGKCVEPPEQKCLPLIQNHNNLNQNRINMIFVGLNYENVNEFKNRVLEILNIDGDSPGFFAEAPFRGNQNKFNFWYVNEIIDYNEDNYHENLQELSSECNNMGLNNKHEINFINHEGRSHAYSKINLYDFMYKVSIEEDEDLYNAYTLTTINVFLHEYGHLFGDLADEYIYAKSDRKEDPYYPNWIVVEWFTILQNVNLPNENQACENWCSREPTSLDELRNFDCLQFRNELDCYSNYRNLCTFIYEEDSFVVNNREYSGCINKVNLCLSIENEETCGSIKKTNYPLDYVWNISLCIWGNIEDNNEEHPYFNSHCIPTSPSAEFYQYSFFDIGHQCVENTGCYQGASFDSYFRSSSNSKMNYPAEPWGYVNERILREKLNQFGGRRLRQIGEQPQQIIFFDEFDEEGKIIDGGMIYLDAMDEEDRNNLLRNVNQRTNIYDDNGNLDYSKINPSVLIDEYKKLSEENIQM